MDSSQFRAAAHSAIDQIIGYYDTIEDRKVLSGVEPGYLKNLLPDGPPVDGEVWAEIQKDIESKIIPGITHWQSPNFLAFFPANSTYPGILGELYSAAFTSANFNWLCSPAATELETIVLDWLCKLLNLPKCYLSTSPNGGGGVIQGSASEAIVTVVVTARDRYLKMLSAGAKTEEEKEEIIDAHRHKLVAIFSDQAHSSTQKGCQISGVKHRSIKVAGSPASNYSLTGPLLRQKLEELKEQGLEPFYITLTLGTTSTCAVDNFEEIIEVLKDYPHIWVHVDAAYAGAALICEEFQHLTAGFEKFDSFDMNMHKWLLTNFDCSCLYVKERKHLFDALSITPAYLRNPFTASGHVTDYRDWQIPLGRRFRALKIWFVMRTYGVSGLQHHVRNIISIGEHFSSLIKSRPDLFTIIAPPAFALTVFVVNPINGGGPEERNKLTKTVYESINEEGKIFITSGVVDEIYMIRVVGASPKTRKRHLERAFGIIVEMAEKVRGEKEEYKNADVGEVGKVQLRGL
ncbi:pyridoxal phosphate-dependent transferase [Morchella snyderi]|nr:pyridoxal phosphate-dependent transferase [Morchella snyderi]